MYDVTKEQKVTTSINGKAVQHVLTPISDDALLSLLDRVENLTDEETLELFYDQFVDRLEGLSGTLPANWKALIPGSEKRDVVRNTIWITLVSKPGEDEDATPESDEEGLSFADYVALDRNHRSYDLATYYNGKLITIPVTMRLFTAKERKDLFRVHGNEANTRRYKVEYAAQIAKAALTGSKPALLVTHFSALALKHLMADSLAIEKN